jgi:hypothetical protein
MDIVESDDSARADERGVCVVVLLHPPAAVVAVDEKKVDFAAFDQLLDPLLRRGVMRVGSEQVEPLTRSSERVVQRSPRRLVATPEEAAWKIDADDVRVCAAASQNK